MIRRLLTLVMTLSVAACTSMNPPTEKYAYCNQLKSQMIFNGATSITRAANIQASELPLEEHSYDQAGCDELR